MRLLCVLVIAIAALGQPNPPAPTPSKVAQPNPQNPASTNQRSGADQRGSEHYPIFVKNIPTPKTDAEAEQERKDREQKSANDWHLVWFNGILAAVALLQLLVYSYQAYKLRQTVDAGEKQSEAMERHITEAGRSATAMEGIAEVIQRGNKAITRAYLTVLIGQASFQERRGPGQNDLKFEARPVLQNTGNTPAKKIVIRIKAAILPISEDVEMPTPEEAAARKGSTIGAHQSATMTGTVGEFVPYDEVPLIKEGFPKALHVWGLVTYEDVFGDPHTTRFGQVLWWQPDNSIFGLYLDGYNDGD